MWLSIGTGLAEASAFAQHLMPDRMRYATLQVLKVVRRTHDVRRHGHDGDGQRHGAAAQVSGYCAGVHVCACLLQRLGLIGQLSGRRYSHGVAPSASTAPVGDVAPTAVCRITMGVTMAFILLIMS
jgi:hypothetical protein